MPPLQYQMPPRQHSVKGVDYRVPQPSRESLTICGPTSQPPYANPVMWSKNMQAVTDLNNRDTPDSLQVRSGFTRTTTQLENVTGTSCSHNDACNVISHSEAGLHELEKREVLGNKGLGKLEFCENCVLGKSTRVSFGRGQHMTEGVIDYVQLQDLWGPSRVESMSGCRYFLSIVDDYSRRVWVHFLRHKNEAFSKFKEWKQLVENQTGRKLKKLRTDNGLEFCNQEFNNLCKESGIARHLTVAGTPQQNGLAERMNRTLLNKVRSPSTALEKKTPMDLWSGHPANYEMLRIFGCVAYSYVNQGKLKPRAIKCIFLGYPEGVKGYRLWRLDDVKPKIIISRDVVFNESLIPSGSKVDDMATYAFAIAEEEDTHEPITFQEAINSSEKDEWVRAMKEEMSSLKKNNTWELVDQPPGQKLISCKWLYKIKEGIECVQKPRYKARVVARGFTQRAGIDYNELEQLDVKTAFLHGNLEETIYMRQLPGFEEGTSNKVCLLKKSLYGLKQSPRQWYKRFGVYIIDNKFSRSNYDSCVYFKEFAPGMYIYLLLYVDDILIACKSKSEIEYTKGLLRKEFDMKELGPVRKILGMEIIRDRGSRTLKVSQSGYVHKILNNYIIDNGKSVFVPLGAHFKVFGNAGKNHWEAVKWILKYLKGTANVGLVYDRDQGKHVDVDGFVDADYAKDPDKGRSITGLTISPNVEVSFFKLLCTTDDIEDMTFDVYALPCYGLVLFVMALFIHAL
ncbi:retrotransposon protein, putative, ty1-copia subclass [Tanacetum coccineum]